MSKPETETAERRKDAAWLVWDLLERCRETVREIPNRHGLMGDVTWHSVDRFDRLIKLVLSGAKTEWIAEDADRCYEVGFRDARAIAARMACSVAHQGLATEIEHVAIPRRGDK